MAKATEDNTLTGAMQRADAAGSEATESKELDRALAQTVEDGIRMADAPICTTHSTSLAREFAAKGESIRDQIADVDAEIAVLQAKRTDLMLSYSMLSHGMSAREAGQKKP